MNNSNPKKEDAISFIIQVDGDSSSSASDTSSSSSGDFSSSSSSSDSSSSSSSSDSSSSSSSSDSSSSSSSSDSSSSSSESKDCVFLFTLDYDTDILQDILHPLSRLAIGTQTLNLACLGKIKRAGGLWIELMKIIGDEQLKGDGCTKRIGENVSHIGTYYSETVLTAINWVPPELIDDA